VLGHIGVGTKEEIFFLRKDREATLFDLSTHMIEELGYKTKKLHGSITNYEESIFLV